MNVSFIHCGDERHASWRLRANIPARSLQVPLNDPDADILVFCKPQKDELPMAKAALKRGGTVIADFCDDHFDEAHYPSFLSLSHYVTCPTRTMKELIHSHGRPDAKIIEDPYEHSEFMPHCIDSDCLWFGHRSNINSLLRITPELEGLKLRTVSNAPGAIPWSPATMKHELWKADCVLLPATAAYKSSNRAVAAIRMGCFVVAEPHPSLEGFPIWQGNVREGVEWAKSHRERANEMILEAQSFVRERFSPATQASAWRLLLASASMSVAARSIGPVGFPLTA